MIRAVLDEVVPADVAGLLASPNLAVDRFPDRWRGLSDRMLLATAEAAEFHWLVTCDKRMPLQQNLSGLSITVLVLPTPQVMKLVRIQRQVQRVLARPRAGMFVVLDEHGQMSTAPAAHIIG